MSDAADIERPAPSQTPEFYPIEFTGSGREYFRIWIVNLALSVVTLGVFSAWAKVRTQRYLYGNTAIAGHTFDYHASPIRILIGRGVVVAILIGYVATNVIAPVFNFVWVILFIVAFPWLAVASLRFNARNTSYRNVRFNFVGDYGDAFFFLVLWRALGVITLGILMPLARRAREYFVVNNYTFGGKHFKTEFAGKEAYKTYGVAIAVSFAGFVLGAGYVGAVTGTAPTVAVSDILNRLFGGALVGAALITAGVYTNTRMFNLGVGNALLDGRHRLTATLSPWKMAGIRLSNLLFVVCTLGLYYPWARIKVAS